MAERPYQVLHIPTTVGGNAPGLSRSLKQLGVQSESWALEQNYLQYAVDRVIWREDDGVLRREIKRWAAIAQALRHADVIHLNFGTSLAWPIAARKTTDKSLATRVTRWLFGHYTQLLQQLELTLYRLLGKPIFVHYQGDDARQGDESLRRFRISIAQHVPADYYDAYSDDFKRRMIRRMARHATQIYAVNPDLMHVLPASSRFIPYSHIDLGDWAPVYPSSIPAGPLRIGHAPSNRRVKGTDRIIEAVERLKAQGCAVELVLIEGVANQEARRLYEGIDVLVDQLHAGWYGGLAVEVMALGKPVLVYIRDKDLGFIPSAMRDDLPVVRVTSDTLDEELRRVAEMPREDLIALAHRSRAFVERWHDPLAIAQVIRLDYERALVAGGRSS